MSSAPQPETQSPMERLFDSPQPRELQLLFPNLDGVASNSVLGSREGSAPNQGRELALVPQDVPFPLNLPAAVGLLAEAEPATEKPKRQASRRRLDWTPPEGMKTFVQERKSGKSKGNKDTYYNLPGVTKNFRSIPEVQRYLRMERVRLWKKTSGTRPSQPAVTRSSSNMDLQPVAESSQIEPEKQIKDEEQAGRPKSRPKLCVQRKLFKRSCRHEQNNI